MALKLKQAGAMVSRQISFEGVVTRAEFIPPDSEPECFEENYDIFSAMVSKLLCVNFIHNFEFCLSNMSFVYLVARNVPRHFSNL